MEELISGYYILNYLILSIALFTIAKALEKPMSFLALIPIINILYMGYIADRAWTITPLLLSFFLPLIGGIYFIILYVYLWSEILNEIGKNRFMSIFMIVPIISLVYAYYVALTCPSAYELYENKSFYDN